MESLLTGPWPLRSLYTRRPRQHFSFFLLFVVSVFSFLALSAYPDSHLLAQTDPSFAPPIKRDSTVCGNAIRVVILGSSTAAGIGASTYDSSWAGKFTRYLKSLNPANEVINLGTSTYTSYQVLCPSHYVAPPGRPSPVPSANITRALSLNPSLIIINLPSNDVNGGFALHETIANYERALLLASDRNIPVWAATAQPRYWFTDSQIAVLRNYSSWIQQRFGERSFDFWTGLARSNGWLMSKYNVDGVHLNDLGHHLLFCRVVEKQLVDAHCHYNALSVPMANAGPDQVVQLPVNAVLLRGSASDTSGIQGLEWRSISGPTTTILTSPSQTETYALGLSPGRFLYRFKATSRAGKTTLDTVAVTVFRQHPDAKAILVNITRSNETYLNPAWNNWAPVGNALASGSLRTADGNSTTILASLSNSENVADNGASYSATMCPPEVLRFASFSTIARTLTVSGLDSNKLYTIELYASRARTDGQTTLFTLGAQNITISTDNNSSQAATFYSQKPDNLGRILVSIAVAPGAVYNYINGFRVLEE
jgi:lysophospholipase L1-like esterase